MLFIVFVSTVLFVDWLCCQLCEGSNKSDRDNSGNVLVIVLCAEVFGGSTYEDWEDTNELNAELEVAGSKWALVFISSVQYSCFNFTTSYHGIRWHYAVIRQGGEGDGEGTAVDQRRKYNHVVIKSFA